MSDSGRAKLRKTSELMPASEGPPHSECAVSCVRSSLCAAARGRPPPWPPSGTPCCTSRRQSPGQNCLNERASPRELHRRARQSLRDVPAAAELHVLYMQGSKRQRPGGSTPRRFASFGSRL